MRCYKCKWNTLVRTDNAICPRKSICKKEDEELYNKWNDKIKIGSKIYFDNEKHGYKVRARDKRFVIAYRNWKDTYYYVIVDLKNSIRGADNYSSCGGYYDYKYCSELELQEALYRLNMEEDKLLKDCIDMPLELRHRQEEKLNFWNKLPEDQQWINNLEISYRNFKHLNIREVK